MDCISLVQSSCPECGQKGKFFLGKFEVICSSCESKFDRNAIVELLKQRAIEELAKRGS